MPHATYRNFYVAVSIDKDTLRGGQHRHGHAFHGRGEVRFPILPGAPAEGNVAPAARKASGAQGQRPDPITAYLTMMDLETFGPAWGGRKGQEGQEGRDGGVGVRTVGDWKGRR